MQVEPPLMLMPPKVAAVSPPMPRSLERLCMAGMPDDDCETTAALPPADAQ